MKRFALLAALILLLLPSRVLATDPQTGIASNYGPGNGVAMHFCTWTYRHQHGCGLVRIRSEQTGREVVVPVLDFCGCVVPNSPHPYRIVDLQFGVVTALGLKVSQGLYPVTVWWLDQQINLPNTAADDGSTLTLIGILLIGFAVILLFDYWWRTRR